MKINNRNKLLVAAAVGLALSTLTARGQLITGTSQGAFVNPLPPTGNVQVFNPSSGTYAALSNFYTGTATPGSNSTSQTGVTFFGTLFSPLSTTLNPLGTTGPVGIGYFVYSNGNTVAGSTVDSIDFSLRLDFSGTGGPLLNASPFRISLDGGAAGPGFIDNQFTITNPGGGSFTLAGTAYNYAFSFDTTSVNIPEAGSGSQSSAVDNLYVTFTSTPVPEPTTYALAGVLALAGIVGLRRFRGKGIQSRAQAL
jgi:hypothetical protein